MRWTCLRRWVTGSERASAPAAPSLPSMRTDFLSRHICSSPLSLLTERPAPFHRHCLRWLPAWRAPLEGAVARFHYPSIRACRRMMSSAVVDACCVEGGASQSISGPQDHGRGRERRPLDLLHRHPSPALPKSGRGRHQLLSPRRRWRSIEKRLVVDLISEHHVESDQELACDGDLRAGTATSMKHGVVEPP